MEVSGNSNKFVAGAGTLSLGIIGTAGAALNAMTNGGIPLLGGGNNRLAEADAKIAKLEAERYTDQAVIAAQNRAAAADVVAAQLAMKLETQAQKSADEIKALRMEFELRAELDRKQAKIDLLEATAPVAANTAAIACLQQRVDSFTRVVIPSSAVCSVGSNSAA